MSKNIDAAVNPVLDAYFHAGNKAPYEKWDKAKQAILTDLMSLMTGLGNQPIPKLEPKDNEPLEVTYYQHAFADAISQAEAAIKNYIQGA